MVLLVATSELVELREGLRRARMRRHKRLWLQIGNTFFGIFFSSVKTDYNGENLWTTRFCLQKFTFAEMRLRN